MTLPPQVIEVEPTAACNLRCRMCHVSYESVPGERFLDVALLDRLPLGPDIHTIVSSGYEPTIHPDFIEMMSKFARARAPIEIVSNGTLLRGDALKALLDCDVRLLTFSFDGINKSTFEHIRRNADHETTIANIVEARRAFAGRDAYVAVNNTVMRCNMNEMVEAAEFWSAHGFDLMRIIPMVVRYSEPELIKESLYPVLGDFLERLSDLAERAIAGGFSMAISSAAFLDTEARARNPERFHGGTLLPTPAAKASPRPRQDAQLGAGPGMTFPCKSPWTFAKVLPNGDVQLCYRFSVGNLRDEEFEDIWLGRKAQEVREQVRRERVLCERCDYFRFCLSSKTIDSGLIENHFSQSLVRFASDVDFESGELRAEIPPEPPKLVSSLNGHNIVYYDHRYFGVPHALGPIAIDKVDISNWPGVVVDRNFATVRKKISTVDGSGQIGGAR